MIISFKPAPPGMDTTDYEPESSHEIETEPWLIAVNDQPIAVVDLLNLIPIGAARLHETQLALRQHEQTRVRIACEDLAMGAESLLESVKLSASHPTGVCSCLTPEIHTLFNELTAKLGGGMASEKQRRLSAMIDGIHHKFMDLVEE